MCVPLARCIVEAAMATATDAPPPPEAPAPTTLALASDEADELPAVEEPQQAFCACRKLKKRVRALEAQMREIYQRMAPASGELE